MKTAKTERFHMRLSPQEAAALRKLARKQRLSESEVVRNLIEQSAKYRKVW